MTDQDRLERLVRAENVAVRMVTVEEEAALLLVRQAAVNLGRELSVWSINGGLRDGLLAQAPGVPDTEHPAAALYHLSLQKGGMAILLDIGRHLRDERTLRMMRDLLGAWGRHGGCVVMVDPEDEMPAAIRGVAVDFELSLPDEVELERILRNTLRQRHEQTPLIVNVSRSELDVIVRNLRGLSARQARQVVLDAVCDDGRFDINDLAALLAAKRRALSGQGLLEFVEAPVDLSEIGGLGRLKGWLAQRQEALTPKAAAFGLPAPRGVLMLGVQGAGKSLAAKAVATAWRMPLMRLDATALYDKYIGESERRLRETLHQAENMAPLVLWIDEIEKAFASAASHSTDGGLSQRMFGTMLTWMQERRAPVFLIATANDIEALPPELLRKGRFDEIFFVDLPEREARRQIVGIHLKKRKRDPGQFDLEALAEASEGFSGAEIEQAVVAGLHAAFAAGTELTTEHVRSALRNSPPLSVTMAERVEALRRWSRGRCVPAD